MKIAEIGVKGAMLLQSGYANETDEAKATTWINQQLEAIGINGSSLT